MMEDMFCAGVAGAILGAGVSSIFVAVLLFKLFDLLKTVHVLQTKIEGLTSTLNESTIKELITDKLEPGVYLPKVDPVTKNTSYVKATDVRDSLDSLYGIDDKSHEAFKDLLDAYHG